MKHLKSYRIFENDNFRPGSGGYLDNDHLETERAAKQLPPEVKKALEDAVSKLSPEDIEALKKQLAGVTKEDIKDAAEEAQAQVQVSPENSRPGSSLDNDHLGAERSTNENFFKKAGSWVSKHKGTIGATLLIAGLGALGVKGEQASHLTDILKDNQVINVLKDPVWLAAALSTLTGLVMTGAAVKQGFAKAGADAKIDWERNMIRKGLAKKDENGVLVSLKTGKPLIYAR